MQPLCNPVRLACADECVRPPGVVNEPPDRLMGSAADSMKSCVFCEAPNARSDGRSSNRPSPAISGSSFYSFRLFQHRNKLRHLVKVPISHHGFITMHGSESNTSASGHKYTLDIRAFSLGVSYVKHSTITGRIGESYCLDARLTLAPLLPPPFHQL
jgi:hypothetical protein